MYGVAVPTPHDPDPFLIRLTCGSGCTVSYGLRPATGYYGFPVPFLPVSIITLKSWFLTCYLHNSRLSVGVQLTH